MAPHFLTVAGAAEALLDALTSFPFHPCAEKRRGHRGQQTILSALMPTSQPIAAQHSVSWLTA
jgi:hypothetical protein